MHLSFKQSARLAVAALAVGLLSLALIACGGSSKSTTTGGGANAATTAPAGTVPGGNSAREKRFATFRECMAKEGVQLPKPQPGQEGVSPFLQGTQLPAGVSRAKYQAALRKCIGARIPPGGGFFNRKSPRFKAVLISFAKCMRAHGVNVPEPNLSGKGPIFNTGALDTQSPKFGAARRACGGLLGLGVGRLPQVPTTPGG